MKLFALKLARNFLPRKAGESGSAVCLFWSELPNSTLYMIYMIAGETLALRSEYKYVSGAAEVLVRAEDRRAVYIKQRIADCEKRERILDGESRTLALRSMGLDEETRYAVAINCSGRQGEQDF